MSNARLSKNGILKNDLSDHTLRFNTTDARSDESVIHDSPPLLLLQHKASNVHPPPYSLTPGENTIGRNTDNDLCLEDQTISRVHAVVKLNGNQATCWDAGSTFGTRLDGKPLKKFQEAPLSTYSIISMGAYILIYLPHGELQTMIDRKHVLQAELERLDTDYLANNFADNVDLGAVEIVDRLGIAAEFRDSQTGQHNQRIGMYTKRLAQALQLPDETCDLLLLAAPLHDVGKIAVPDNILLKPGKLTIEERSIMQQHAKIGAELLKNHQSKLMKLAHNIALSHHEKWDGTGYPNRLAGEEISVEGRLVAVVDVFDALMSKRPYKEAWSLETVIQTLTTEKGKHFDPVMVDAFLSVQAEMVHIMESNT